MLHDFQVREPPSVVGGLSLSLQPAYGGYSATMSAFTTPPPTATPSSPPSINNGSNAMSSGANYFFGFLITFVVLLLIFVACGIGSRRFFYSRRTLFVNDVTDWATQTTQPTFWEAWLKEGGPNWNTMAVSTKKTNQNSLPIFFFFFLSFQPLSASLVRRKNEDLETPPPQRHHPFVTFF